MNPIELLAPAKDVACGMAAINSGADAVYIGAKRFGAREAAGNSLEEIAALITHAHLYWAKVYVTINTLLTNDEIPQAVELIERLHELNVDGLIIQDTGLLECTLPPIPLIASTQMHNNTPEKVAFLEQVGFQRAILARELTLEQIQSIRRKTTMELECFVHGALCVSYSGQCYMSYAIGGRSGNRGQCAQPCRKSYSLVDGQGKMVERDKHLLSLHDLNLSDHLPELLAAGVTSFKIEGRLKDQAYVANVVSYYRQKLDAAMEPLGLQRASSGHSTVGFIPNPVKTFNRGFSSYFFTGNGDGIGAIETPKMVGEPVGTVVNLTNRSFIIDATAALHNGDGLSFFTSDGTLSGTTVNSVEGNIIVPLKIEGIERGMTLYRNHDHQFLTQLGKSPVVRSISVTMAVRETAEGIELTARDEDGATATVQYATDKVPANNPESALATMARQLAKCGGTAYHCADVSIDLPTVFFIPISELNAIRRDVLEQLTTARAALRPQLHRTLKQNTVPYPEEQLTYQGNVLNRMAERFYRRHGVTKIEPAAESGSNMRGKKVMTNRYCLRRQLGLCLKDSTAPNIPGPLFLIDGEGHRLRLQFNCRECQMEIYLVSGFPGE